MKQRRRRRRFSGGREHVDRLSQLAVGHPHALVGAVRPGGRTGPLDGARPLRARLPAGAGRRDGRRRSGHGRRVSRDRHQVLRGDVAHRVHVRVTRDDVIGAGVRVEHHRLRHRRLLLDKEHASHARA